MKLVTKQSLVAPAIEQYLKMAPNFVGKYYTWPQEIYDKMIKLDVNTCTVAQFNEAMGRTDWTSNHCDECGEDFDTLVHIGNEPDYDARYQRLCSDCLSKALGMSWGWYD